MSINMTPEVNCKYGSPMGRRGNPHVDPDYDGLMLLRHVPLDRGGYDRGGAYWGTGSRLYGYATAEGDWEESGFLRAHGREDAKRKVREMYPKCRFSEEKKRKGKENQHADE